MITQVLKITFLSLAIFIAACNNNQLKKTIVDTKSDSIKKDTVKQYANILIDKKFDELAAYIAGIKNIQYSMLDSTYTENDTWISFCDELDNMWKKHDSDHIGLIKTWRKAELERLDTVSSTIFYPFSGPDILNAYTLFPKAKEFIMIGLEPAGNLPDFKNSTRKTDIPGYLRSVKNSLTSILNFSFFRTKSMAVDLNGEELNGTIHLMLFFLKRTGNSIVDIKPANINQQGEIVINDSFADSNTYNKGVEIDFVDSDSIVKKAYYFSVNLANEQLAEDTGFLALVRKKAPFNTYLKSASYLMHKNYFSGIRDLILDNSANILEDDSGIPFKYFTENNKWNIFLYGSYTAPIAMFSGFYQPDLKQAFADTLRIKRLPFGIGYKYKLGESVLILAEKK